MRLAAEQAATALVQRAQQQAATIEERARQELFWYRRQLRREREVITRCQRALVDQVTMLSGLAVETARSLYETRRVWSMRIRPDCSTMNCSSWPSPTARLHGDQNRRSSALSMPRKVS